MPEISKNQPKFINPKHISKSYLESQRNYLLPSCFIKYNIKSSKSELSNKSPKLESQSHIQFIKNSKYQRTYYHKYCHHRVITNIPKRILFISNSYNPKSNQIRKPISYSRSSIIPHKSNYKLTPNLMFLKCHL